MAIYESDKPALLALAEATGWSTSIEVRAGALRGFTSDRASFSLRRLSRGGFAEARRPDGKWHYRYRLTEAGLVAARHIKDAAP